MQLSREERLIKLNSITNVRDLGGYETQSGHYTRVKKFVRAANPSSLDNDDIESIYQYGIRAVIDLRSDYELEAQPSKLKDYKDIAYYGVNLMQSKDLKVVPEDVKNFKDLSGLYIYMLEANKNTVKEVFDIFLKYPYECVLFNCSAGKDRTGLIAALLLDLAGCHEYDIVKDYSESYENNLPIIEELEKLAEGKLDKTYLSSNPTYMIRFLGYLREHYGSAKDYLISCGINEDDLQEIIENFIL